MGAGSHKPAKIEAVSKISIPTEVLAQKLDGETVLLDLASERFFGLDEVSTRVWQLLQSGLSKAEIVETLLDEYEVERGLLDSDIGELLGRLSEAGLITLG
jgi:hypothetical protein